MCRVTSHNTIGPQLCPEPGTRITSQFLNPVVNCFWIVSLRDWAQRHVGRYSVKSSCELLLNCIFERLSTTTGAMIRKAFLLWIAFELYLWEIEHNGLCWQDNQITVVNCFWIVSLSYWVQPCLKSVPFYFWLWKHSRRGNSPFFFISQLSQ